MSGIAPAPIGKRMLNASTGKGRVALVTGAGSPKGFGSNSAILMARHGARVVVTDLERFAEGGAKVVETIKAEGGDAVWFALDVTDEENWKKAIAFAEETYGPLDVLVNNAGIAQEYSDYMRPSADPEASISKHPTSDWKKMMAINLDGVYYGIKYGAGSMEKNPAVEGKSIVNISSGAGMIGGTGITSAAVRTNILDMLFDNPALSKEIVDDITDRWNAAHPIGRLGDPIEVANLILYLASTESSFTSGAEHVIDGALLTTAGFGTNPFPPKSVKST